jgi:hypothetical protein
MRFGSLIVRGVAQKIFHPSYIFCGVIGLYSLPA